MRVVVEQADKNIVKHNNRRIKMLCRIDILVTECPPQQAQPNLHHMHYTNRVTRF